MIAGCGYGKAVALQGQRNARLQLLNAQVVDFAKDLLQYAPGLSVDEELWARDSVGIAGCDGATLQHGGFEKVSCELRPDRIQHSARWAVPEQGDGSQQCGAGPVGDAADDRIVAGDPT